MDTIDRFKTELPEMTAWRRDFHTHPEIGFEEVRTSGIVASLLQDWGLEVHRGLAGTGVVGVLRGKRPGNRALGLRADMDALPMDEKADVAWRSTTPGKFHGCGHDGHTSILLGVAKVLASDPDFAGTVNFIFQPAEETLFGGKRMVDDGLFTQFPCDEVYGLHNFPGLGNGRVAVQGGVMMAGADGLRIEVRGTGAHAAMPHLGNDPVVIAAHLVVALQSILSRTLDPLEAGVISICMIHGGSATNVIPDMVELRGTIRALSIETRALLHKRIREVCAGVATANAADIMCDIIEGCPPTINAVDQAEAVARVARRVAGPENVIEAMKPVMGSEDFSFMLQQCKGAYFVVGQGGQACHHPEYQFDDSIMPLAATMFTEIVRDRLNEGVA